LALLAKQQMLLDALAACFRNRISSIVVELVFKDVICVHGVMVGRRRESPHPISVRVLTVFLEGIVELIAA
jgi:hypothetical protein